MNQQQRLLALAGHNESKVADLTAYAAKIAAAAPPLTPHQRDRLAVLLQPQEEWMPEAADELETLKEVLEDD